MTKAECEEWRLLLQADADGELGVAEAAALERHVGGCAGCGELRQDLAALSGRLRRGIPREPAPDRLRDALAARLAAAAPAPAVPPPPPLPTGRVLPFRRFARPAVTFALGAALAASVTLMVTPGGRGGMGDMVAGEIVAGHIRALQPGHLMDVASSDRHTVKPWFDGRLDYAPPVKDLASDGFPLLGGRLDYIGGRPVAALAYGRAKHIINLYVWPRGAGAPTGADETASTRDGYNTLRWRTPAMEAWAVSDLEADELARFARLWRAAP